eukprot:COSAG01_NODE_12775_length_1687_cov_249.148615_4_plen_50_part_01
MTHRRCRRQLDATGDHRTHQRQQPPDPCQPLPKYALICTGACNKQRAKLA